MPDTQPLVLYLSASVNNAPLNLALRDHLPADRFELVLPQEFTPLEASHPSYPRAIYQRCIDEMERCDAAVLLLDAFGIDCASEAGWICAKGKPLIGIAGGSLRFLRHWMVKGNLTHIISTNRLVTEALEADPIVGSLPLETIGAWDELADTIAAMVRGDAT